MENETITLMAFQASAGAEALEGQMNAIMSMLEDFDQQGNTVAGAAAMMALMGPIEEAHAMLDNITADPDDFLDREEQAMTIGQALRHLRAVTERADQTRLKNPRHKEEREPSREMLGATQTASTVITGLARFSAALGMTGTIQDRSADQDHRWMCFGIGQALIDLSITGMEMTSVMENEKLWAGDPRARNAITARPEFQEYWPEDPEGRFQTAARDLCAEKGIDRVSHQMIRRPGLLKDMSFQTNPANPHELSIHAGFGEEYAIDGLLVRHEGLTHALVFGETYPMGFPASRAIEIADEFAQACRKPGRAPADSGWEEYLETARTARRTAELELHDWSKPQALEFIEFMMEILPEDSEMVQQVMHLISGRDRNVENSLLPYGLTTRPMTGRNDTTRILKLARNAGMRPNQIWELTRFLGVDPEKYGVRRPGIPSETLEAIIEKARELRIPGRIAANLRDELSDES